MNRTILFLVFFLYGSYVLHAKDIAIIDRTKPAAEKEAILILPGFGSINHGVKNIRDYYSNRGYDLFIPDFISRKSLEQCTRNIDGFINKYDLDAYKDIHVLCYIIGGWSFNLWLEDHKLPNLSHLVYDRSPIQERAPYALVEDLPFLSYLFAGKTIKEFSQTPYIVNSTVEENRIGIIIETVATKLMIKHRETAEKLGPINWNVEGLMQAYGDYCYINLNHDDLYEQFDEAGEQILYFFKHGLFKSSANRIIPVTNLYIE